MGDIAEQLIDSEMFGGYDGSSPLTQRQRGFKWWKPIGEERIQVQDMTIEQLEAALLFIETKQKKLTWVNTLNKRLRYLKRTHKRGCPNLNFRAKQKQSQ
tara:strand:- start:4 stop:303 length:300 start_codon:yes stop_codon:yes gene_type:complete